MTSIGVKILSAGIYLQNFIKLHLIYTWYSQLHIDMSLYAQFTLFENLLLILEHDAYIIYINKISKSTKFPPRNWDFQKFLCNADNRKVFNGYTYAL